MLRIIAMSVACGRNEMKVARYGAMNAPVQIPIRIPVSA